jgi:signal-transduction protein with cAMP-binding, CBS, and nucleotidyltransferase domain
MLTVAEALKNLQHPETRTIIINKRHEGDEYGVVMLSDIARKVLAADRSPKRVNMYEIMSKPVISVHSTMDIRYCVKLLDKFGLTRVPVIENGKILGLVSYTDIVLKGIPSQNSQPEIKEG